MVVTRTLTVAAGGSADTPTQNRWSVPDGLIYQFEMYFPPGSSGLLHAWVSDGGFQLWPWTPGESFWGDNTLISFPERYFVNSAGHNLDVWAYNLDVSFEHTVQLRIGIVSDPNLISGFLPAVDFSGLEQTLADIVAQQDVSRQAQRDAVIASLPVEEEPQ